MTINIDITLGATTVATVGVNSIHIDIVVNGSQIPSPSICERVDECLDIPTADGTYVLKILNGVKSWIAATGGGVWGSITGTLSDQTDLQNALNNKQNALGYTPENIDNKTDVMSGNTTSSTKYLSAKGVYDWVIGLGYLTTSAAAATYATITSLANYLTITAAASTYATIASLSSYLTTATAAATYQVILTAANFGSFLNSLSAKTIPTDNDVVGLMDSADSNNSKKITWANIKAAIFSFIRMRLGYNMSTLYSTSSTAEIVADFYEIPANTLIVGDDIFTMVGWTGTRNAGTNRIRLGFATTLPTIGSAPPSYTRLAQQQSTTNNAGGYNRKTFKVTASNQLSSFAGDTAWTEDFAGTGSITNYTYNINTTYYIMVLLTSGDATNVLQLLDNHYVISR